MSRRSFVDFGRKIAKALKGPPNDFGALLEQFRPEDLSINERRRRSGLPPVQSQHNFPATVEVDASWLQKGDKMIVIQDDEGVVKKTVVDMLHEATEEIEFWRSRGLWRNGMPDPTATRCRIEEMEAELEDLRHEHMETLEQLT